MKRHNLLITLALCVCLLAGFSNAMANHLVKARQFPAEVAPSFQPTVEVLANEEAPVYNWMVNPGYEPIPGEGCISEMPLGGAQQTPFPKIEPLMPINLYLQMLKMRLGW